jgi:hypothetical protein
MNRSPYALSFLFVMLLSCSDDNALLFEKPAEVRAAEAIEALRQELTAGAWKVKYRPENTSGSYWVLLNFNNNGYVQIRSDLSANNGEFFDQTITYRIDNSLGIELILESYCMFSFLFEQFSATFGAEYEFIYVNKTPDNSLVFTSKTDPGVKTQLVFQPATQADESLLGIEVSQNLFEISRDLPKFSSSLKLEYESKDLVFFLSLDEITRNATITSASRKSVAGLQAVNLETGYLIQGDSMVFDSALSGTFFGNNIQVKSLKLNSLGESTFNGCANPITLHHVSGKTSQNDNITLGTALVDLSGSTFTQSDFYFAPLVYIFDNGRSVRDEITQHVEGALEMHLYYNYDIGQPFYAIGLVIQNPNGSITFALRQFTPVLNGNNLIFNFAPQISIFGSPTTANVENLNIYLNALTDGNNTYVYKLFEGIYEFHNPCTGWSFVFIDTN